MIRPTVLGILAALTAGSLAQAAEFPLAAKYLSRQEAQSCPGGYGGYGSVTTKKPVRLKAMATAVSAHPLFCQLYAQGAEGETVDPTKGMMFFLDESKGDGKGYDRLVADLNENGDLTDDPVFERLDEGRLVISNANQEQASFGPFDLPAHKAIGPWRPRFFAETFLYNKQELKNPIGGSERYIGQLRIYSGNLLETTVELNGIRQKFGLVDGNCNFRMGDRATLTKIRRSSNDPGSWYLSPGDYYLRDRDNSGKYERTLTGNDSEIFSSLVYFGAKPFVATVSSDLKSIRFEPYAEAMGELRVQPQMKDLVLAWQKKTNQWEALTPEIKDHKAILPVGVFRVSTCAVEAKAGGNSVVQAQSSQGPDRTFSITADKPTKLEFGLPLSLAVTAERDTSGRVTEGGFMGALRSLFSGGSGGAQSAALLMNVTIAGASGERYTSFIKSSTGTVDPPRFKILDTGGAQVASGNFEFG